jgi:DHA1 family bicyclomycin/chloramphenicol resistance-like MFS transporter
MSHITMMFALAPAIAPVIGGRLQSWFGWRSVFVFLVLATFSVWLACWRLLPETLPAERRQPLHAGYLARTYWKVMTSPEFLFACGGLAFNFAGFFIYVMSAPVFLMRHLGLPETGFFWLFGPAMAGLMSGAWLSGRLAGKFSLKQTILRGYLIMGAAAVINIGLNLWLPPGLPWSVAPLFVYTLGMSLAMPCLTLLALDPFPQQRGLAASCQMFLQSIANGAIAGALAPALWGSTRTMAFGMGVLMLLGAGSAWLHSRLAHPATNH